MDRLPVSGRPNPFTKSQQGLQKSQLLDSSFLRVGIETEPRNHAVLNPTLGLIVIGLPASERCSPNSKHLSELPLMQSQLFALFVDMLA